MVFKTCVKIGAMDLLSDILTQAGLHKKIWSGIKLPNDGSLEFPCNKSLGLHIALSEGLFLRTSKKVFALGARFQ